MILLRLKLRLMSKNWKFWINWKVMNQIIE